MRIYAGCSDDGLCFALEAQPLLAPSPEADDRDGCKYPTVIVTVGETFVYYSGWNEADKRG